jgi:23S rRNA pseudouridine2457 synthase
VLIAFHKPYGVITQFTAKGNWATLATYGLPPNVYPVGRLDADSEGLLLLTDDGKLQHRLSDPRFEHPKTYWAQVEGTPTNTSLEPLRRGLSIQDYKTRPCQAQLLVPQPPVPPRVPPIRFRKSVPDHWIELILHEGKNRQVRRMTAAIGFPTLRLIRQSIGGITLSPLSQGQWQEVSPEDALKKTL